MRIPFELAMYYVSLLKRSKDYFTRYSYMYLENLLEDLVLSKPIAIPKSNQPINDLFFRSLLPNSVVAFIPTPIRCITLILVSLKFFSNMRKQKTSITIELLAYFLAINHDNIWQVINCAKVSIYS